MQAPRTQTGYQREERRDDEKREKRREGRGTDECQTFAMFGRD